MERVPDDRGGKWRPLAARRLDSRAVGPRDGLQLEAPLSFAAKAELLEALTRTGVKRIEATAFVSPKAVPSLADAELIAEHIRRWPDITWSALVANQRGVERALAAGMSTLEYVVSASDGHSVANSGRPTRTANERYREHR